MGLTMSEIDMNNQHAPTNEFSVTMSLLDQMDLQIIIVGCRNIIFKQLPKKFMDIKGIDSKKECQLIKEQASKFNQNTLSFFQAAVLKAFPICIIQNEPVIELWNQQHQDINNTLQIDNDSSSDGKNTISKNNNHVLNHILREDLGDVVNYINTFPLKNNELELIKEITNLYKYRPNQILVLFDDVHVINSLKKKGYICLNVNEIISELHF